MEPQEEKILKTDILKLRQNVISEFKNEIPLLKLQREYESLIADIEEARLRRTIAVYRLASLEAKDGNEQPRDNNIESTE
jgi:hypothetical protein